MAALSEKTRSALAAARDDKERAWIETSIAKGWEGAGVLFTCGGHFVLGVNKKGEAEYPGGKVEAGDASPAHTAQREVLEETALALPVERFATKYRVEGGSTGYPSWVFRVDISEAEREALGTGDRTFSSFVRAKHVFDRAEVEDADRAGVTYPVRKFNYKYVLPQIRDQFVAAALGL